MAIRVVQTGKPAFEIVATRGFLAELSDAEQQQAFKTWAAVLNCDHVWEPAPDGEERCTRCAQKRVPSIEKTPGLVVVEVRPDRKVWAKRDEYPACTCAACRLQAQAAAEQVAVHSSDCPCECPKGTIDLWTLLLPEEY
ncbi:MAG: hypothetical protein HY509_04680 [Acidobacteria bacterium]|nr:hypothetical protein [Acidobacteriota bacterium]